jgi:hypothetical protein
MSTIRITELVENTNIGANTSNTIFVGVNLSSLETSKYTATTVANGLYSNNPLKVGQNQILFPNTIAQFSGNAASYLQLNIQNFDSNGTGDIVVTADTGTDTDSYINLGHTNSEYDINDPYNSLGTSIEPLSGYLYVKGNGEGGNLVIGTIDSNTEIRFLSGGIDAFNVSTKIINSGIKFPSNKYITFSDDTIQSTAAASLSYSQASFALANSVNVYSYTANTWLQANTGAALASAKVYTDTANVFIQSNYLANTSGTFNGDLLLTGNVVSRGTISINASNITDNTVFLYISGAANSASQPPSNPGYTIHTTSIDGQANRVTADAFSNTATHYSSFIARRGRGTAENPLPVQSGDIIARFGGNGYGNTKFSQFGDGRIEVVAVENFTDTSKRTQINLLTTNTNSNTANVIASFNGNTVVFTGAVEPQKGFIYTPKIYRGAQTAITIDFSTDSMIKASLNDNLTVTTTNYTYGKVVELWLTNISTNQNKTVSHGCQANNSTLGTLSFTLHSGRSAYLRYFSIDGDNANTFVSINYQ